MASVSLAEYLKNPCSKLSIPYWKNRNMSMPANIKIVHQSNFSDSFLMDYADIPYFRLSHTLCNIHKKTLNEFYIKTVKISDVEQIVEIINKSYLDLSVTYEQMISYTKTNVYDINLWILVYDKQTDRAIGCGIADLDTETKEGILEWIQVLPQYRGMKIGQLIVNELLFRMVSKASFATVSGKVNDVTNPEGLYRKCDFFGNDIWHILYAK